MRRYLVVLNETLGGRDLRRAIKQRMANGPCRFHLLVLPPGPTTAWESLIGAYEGEVPGDHASVAEAEARLRAELASLRDLGADVDGEVGKPDPVDAVRAVLGREGFDEVVLCTPPAGPSSWIGADLPDRIRRHVDLPVTAITARAASRWRPIGWISKNG